MGRGALGRLSKEGCLHQCPCAAAMPAFSLPCAHLLEGWLQSPQVWVGLPSSQPEKPQPIFSSPYRKLHSGMKTYGCELCGKRFLDSLRLRMHLLAHSGRPCCPDWPIQAQAMASGPPWSLLRAQMSPLPAGAFGPPRPRDAPSRFMEQRAHPDGVTVCTNPSSCSLGFPRALLAPSAQCGGPSRVDDSFSSMTVVAFGSRGLMNLTLGFTLCRSLSLNRSRKVGTQT